MQVSKHVHAIRIPFQVSFGPAERVDRFVHVYLVYGKTNVTLIDSGIASSEATIFEYLKGTAGKRNAISMIILTHSHPDHIGAARAIQQETGCKIAAHGGERRWIEDVEQQNRERPVPGFDALVGGSVKIDYLLNDGDRISLGDDLRLEVFHTPGHSKGSISLLLPHDRVLFVGDAVPLPGDIPIYEDVLLAVGSIKKLKAIGGVKMVLSSWDDPQEAETAYQRMDESLHYLQRIHTAVRNAAGEGGSLEPMQLCERVAANLGFPQIVANPLVAKTFQAHLKIRDREHLLRDE